jgi:hypothetical protein
MHKVLRKFDRETRNTLIASGYVYPGGTNPQTDCCIMGDLCRIEALILEVGGLRLGYEVYATRKPGPHTIANAIANRDQIHGKEYKALINSAADITARNDRGEFATPQDVARLLGRKVA